MRIKYSDKVILIIVLIMITTFIFIKIFTINSEYLLLDYASFKLSNITNSFVNDSIKTVILENNYSNIIKSYKDESGNIINLDFDNLVVNNILYSINERILSNVLLLENGEYNTNQKALNIFVQDKIYYIPMGVIFNIPILNTIGPKIPFKVELLGDVNNSTKIEIKEYGINSSLIQLILNIDVKLKVIMPFKSTIVNTKKSVILDSKVVQGVVPNYYGGSFSTSLN